jgi:glycosyltransferase involved in cell wall biosynthesis
MAERPCLLFVTQVIDPNDPVLGFATRWARALAERCDRLVVIANEVRLPLSDLDVRSLGKESGHGRLRRTARYMALLDRLGREQPWSGLLAHMCPSYLTAAAPVARLRGIPLWLWFAFRSESASLRVAERLATGILTSLPGSYPRRVGKVHVIGQATDLALFAFEPSSLPRPPLQLVAIGRASPSKGLITIIEAVARARSRGVDVRVRLIAPATTEEERRYRAALAQFIKGCDIREAVDLDGEVSPAEIPSVLRRSHALINNTASGSGDKVVFEAMATGRPVIASNASFQALLEGLAPPAMFPPDDADVLASRIQELASRTTDQLAALGVELRRRVARGHSLDLWAEKVIATITTTWRD